MEQASIQFWKKRRSEPVGNVPCDLMIVVRRYDGEAALCRDDVLFPRIPVAGDWLIVQEGFDDDEYGGSRVKRVLLLPKTTEYAASCRVLLETDINEFEGWDQDDFGGCRKQRLQEAIEMFEEDGWSVWDRRTSWNRRTGSWGAIEG